MVSSHFQAAFLSFDSQDNTMKKLLISALVIATLSACSTISTSSSTPAANDALEQERQENLRLSHASAKSEVFYQRGKMAQGKSRDYTVHLKAGHQYGIYSDCKEAACTDLNMDLLFNGKVVDSDTESDTYPLFTFQPTQSGKYTIRPIMKACAANQCEYHVHVVEEAAE